jgi:hypothetical protein
MSLIRKLLKGLARFRHVAAVAALVFAVLAVALWWEASHALREAHLQRQVESVLAFSDRVLERVAPADVDPIAAPAAFRDAAVFHEHLYTAGPSGISEFDAQGGLIRQLRPGVELPAAAVSSIAVGAVGDVREPVLLAATMGEGLLLFDGRHIRQVRPQLPPLRQLTAVMRLAANRVLLGTDTRGVMLFDGRELTVAHPALSDVAVTTLAGREGDVWVGTRDRGVLHWRAGQVDRFGEDAGLPDARVMSIAVSGARAYVGTAIGVAEFQNGKYVRTLGSGLFANALAVRNDTLLVGTIDDTIARIPLDARLSRAARPLVVEAPGTVRRFLELADALYVLTGDSLFAMAERAAGWRRDITDRRAPLTDGNVSALSVDATGRLWVGYFDRGLDILGRNGALVRHVENDRVFCINRIVHDVHGGVTAVATANGLVLFDGAGTQKRVLGRADGLIADHVTDLLLTGDRMTVATPAGLTFIDPDGSRSLYAFHGLVNNHVYALGAAGTEVIAGTLGGISVLDQGAVQANYSTSNSVLTHNWVTAVARVGDEWFVGTYGGGLYHFDRRGSWRTFEDVSRAIEVNPNAMAVTGTHVFAGTLSQGLLVFDRRLQRWRPFSSGLPSMNVTALAVDGGVVYIGTDNGIVRVGEQVFGLP